MEEIKQETNLEKAERLNKELEEKIAKNTELLQSIDKANAERLLAGTGGGRVEIQVREETPKEYAQRVLAGKVKAI
jgi:hypothetical protein